MLEGLEERRVEFEQRAATTLGAIEAMFITSFVSPFSSPPSSGILIVASVLGVRWKYS